MSRNSYLVPAQNWQAELEIKRSKFLCFAGNADTPAKAEAFIKDLRQLHPQANHVCWAYIAGTPDTTQRSMSDDGEPSGTAGMPMLNVLNHSGLGDIVVAVVRYFGGTKLGTGGLQRAYSDAVSLLLNHLPTKTKVHRTCLHLSYGYGFQALMSRALESFDIDNLESEYSEKITLRLAIASSEQADFIEKVTDLTSGQIHITLP